MSLQHRTETELLDEIERLKAQVAYWRSEARVRVEDKTIAVLQMRLGLSRQQAWVLAVRYRQQGAVVPLDHIARDIPAPEERQDDRGLVRVVICKLRGKIGRDAIGHVWAAGYYLTTKGISIVEAALAPTN